MNEAQTVDILIVTATIAGGQINEIKFTHPKWMNSGLARRIAQELVAIADNSPLPSTVEDVPEGEVDDESAAEVSENGKSRPRKPVPKARANKK